MNWNDNRRRRRRGWWTHYDVKEMWSEYQKKNYSNNEIMNWINRQELNKLQWVDVLVLCRCPSISEYYSFAPFSFVRHRCDNDSSWYSGACLSATTKSISIINLKMDLENSIELFLFHPNSFDSIAEMLLAAAAAATAALIVVSVVFFVSLSLSRTFLRILNFISVSHPNVYQTISETRTKIGLWTHSNTLWKLLEALTNKHTGECVFSLSANQKQRR